MADSTNTKEYCRVEEIAQLFGISVRRVQQLTQEGIITSEKTKAGRQYEKTETIQAYIQYLSDKAHGRTQNESEAALKKQKIKAEIALKESQGELHRLRTDIATGKYISVEEVKVDYAKFFVVFKKFALSIPSRMAGIIAGYVEPALARGMEKDMAKEIDTMLKTFVVAAHADDGGERM